MGKDTLGRVLSLEAYRKQLEDERRKNFSDGSAAIGELIGQILAEANERPEPLVEETPEEESQNVLFIECVEVLLIRGLLDSNDVDGDLEHEPGDTHCTISLELLASIIAEGL